MAQFIDKTGQPRSNEEIIEALNVVEQLMLRPPMTMPMLVVNLGTIKNALEELLQRRGLRETQVSSNIFMMKCPEGHGPVDITLEELMHLDGKVPCPECGQTMIIQSDRLGGR